MPHRISKAAQQMPMQKILLSSVEVPKRRDDLQHVLKQMSDTKHDLTIVLADLGDRGKYHNINLALATYNVADYDWLIVIDDDVDIPRKFLDNFLFLATLGGLKLCQPAHRYFSYGSYDVTYRRFNSLVRTTHFVECGPITAFHRDIVPHIYPFPDLRWAWGMDVHWSEIARAAGMSIGIVDATPIGHLRPVAGTYGFDTAIAEARNYLRDCDITPRERKDILKTVSVQSNLSVNFK